MRLTLAPMLAGLALVAPVRAQDPDLVVDGFDLAALSQDPQTLRAVGSVGVTIRNVGVAVAAGNIRVLAFDDSDGDGGFDPARDTVLGAADLNGLGAGQTSRVTIPIDALFRFRGAPIWAIVDSENVVAESDETNNLGDSGAACRVRPVPGALRPVLEWSWRASNQEPSSLNVMMTPSVIDLDGDRIPEVVFGSTASLGGGNVEVGILRALDGRSGAEVFTVSDAALRINTAASLATGDIDGDGRPEIVACDATGARLIAFEHDGSFKWRSVSLEAINWGAISLVDLDRDGDVEIVVGRQVLDHDGQLVWTGTGGRGSQGTIGPVSCVADIDLDGDNEVIAGNTVYGPDGTIEWTAAGLGDGTPGVADFDGDPQAEVVLVTGGRVVLLDTDGRALWNVPIPGGGAGGPPTIADFDGDGAPEVGVAGAVRYVVFETDGRVRWESVTRDTSSNRTGSSVFDFEGDGEAEVVYRDELRLRIYRGRDGFVLFETPMSSCTWHEYVLVADVDGDASAEIVAVANQNCGFGPENGVFVFGAAESDWVATRPVWNQHTYHITNVEDDGRIPTVEQANWRSPVGSPFNNFRQNVLTRLDPTSRPDLTASRLLLPCVGFAGLGVRVGNGGAIFAPAGVSVSFYDGDPAIGGSLLASVATTRRLAPGEFEDVLWQPATLPSITGPVFARVDDDGTGAGSQVECDELNNTHSQALCAASAGAVTYGAGFPGTLGTPALTVDVAPLLGTTVQIRTENSRGVPTPACMIVGFRRADLPSQYGGRFLVDQVEEFGLPLEATGRVSALQIPCLPEWCGRTLTLQVVTFDPGAAAGVSFTPGLELTFGR